MNETYEIKAMSEQNVIQNESVHLDQMTYVFVAQPIERFSRIVSRSRGPRLGLQWEVLEVV